MIQKISVVFDGWADWSVSTRLCERGNVGELILNLKLRNFCTAGRTIKECQVLK